MQVFRAFVAKIQLVGTMSLVVVWLGVLRVFTQDLPNFP